MQAAGGLHPCKRNEIYSYSTEELQECVENLRLRIDKESFRG